MKSRIGITALVCALAVPALAQTPDYIRAKSDAVRAAFGPDVAATIFSDAYTVMRRDMIDKSARRIPTYECPATPLMALAWVIPYPVKPGAVSWVEQFVVDCKPRTQRNFLIVIDRGRPRMIELLPGATAADPLLQRDTFAGSNAAIAGARPKDCDRQWVVDTRLVAPRRDNEPWSERWIYDMCGTRAEVEMTFTPSPRGGTTWNAKLAK
ncbi:MAG: hypothetical protein KJZ73_00480 [Pseudorhodoplanes sp.]|nr:hypothetical protein [Pseudorhodoplanes sp.]GIK79689.1 MAG: hypothetical protein BroJett024_07940 [Alphaproteobacteria bacterium]